MSAQLHRHRRGIFEDEGLTSKQRAKLVAALDVLIDALQPHVASATPDARRLTLPA